MRLRAKFAILVAGIIVVPVLVAALMVLMHYAFSRLQDSVSARSQLLEPEGGSGSEGSSGTPPSAKILHFAVLAPDGRVVQSTLPDLPAGSVADPDRIAGLVRARGSFMFQLEALHPGEPDGPVVLLQFPRQIPQAFVARTFKTVLYTSLALLAFASVMSFLILRSLNRSIVDLERATRRVAEGDLDFHLEDRGRDEISSLTQSFDSMRRSLKDEQARRARFIMGVSHDLKTPLALIQGYVEAIQDGYAEDPELQGRYLSIIMEKSRTLEAMIEDLIEFVRMETGEWRMTHREVPLRGLMLRLAQRYSEDAVILKRRFSFDISLPEDVLVAMDENLVSRALENVLGNAIRYTGPQGTITLESRLEGEQALAVIRDTGIGIPAEEMEKIFDPFYRGSGSRREQGFGLGLTTVKSILESHGWGFQVRSQEGSGTEFLIRMGPVSRGQPREAAQLQL